MINPQAKFEVRTFHALNSKCKLCFILGHGWFILGTSYPIRQDAQLLQRDRAAGCVIVFAKSRTLELGDNILRTL